MTEEEAKRRFAEGRVACLATVDRGGNPHLVPICFALDEVNASQRVFLSSTTIRGRHTLRIAILSHRTHLDRVDEAVDLIEKAARG